MLLGSFFISVSQSIQNANYAFYMLPSRAWEMLAGGLVFYLTRRNSFWRKYGAYLYVSGLIFIIVSIFLYDADTVWPGIPATLPVLGTMLILISEYKHWSNSNVLVQRLGDWSYSIYLWHWPLVVMLVLLGLQGFSVWSLLLIFVSVFLGLISYRLVENPVRKLLTDQNNWKVLLLVLLGLALALVPAKQIRKEKGYMGRVSTEVYKIFNAEFDHFGEMEKCHKKRKENGSECLYGDGDEVLAIMLGDSHAMSFMPLLVDSFSKESGVVLDWSASGCHTLEGVSFTEGTGLECSALLNKIFSEIGNYKNIPVFISNRYSAALVGGNEHGASKKPNLFFNAKYSEYSEDYTREVYDSYKSTICKIAKNNPVYMFSPVPELKLHVPKTMGRALMYRNERIRVSVSRNEFETRNLWANQLLSELQEECGVKVIDLTSTFCDSENCYGDREGKPMYFDDDHLNTYGALLLKGILEAEL